MTQENDFTKIRLPEPLMPPELLFGEEELVEEEPVPSERTEIIRERIEVIPEKALLSTEQALNQLILSMLQMQEDIANLLALFKETVPVGGSTSLDVELVGNSKEVKADQYGGPWVSALISSDGPDTVQIAVNDTAKGYYSLTTADSPMGFDFKRKKIERLYFKCISGESATVHVFGLY